MFTHFSPGRKDAVHPNHCARVQVSDGAYDARCLCGRVAPRTHGTIGQQPRDPYHHRTVWAKSAFCLAAMRSTSVPSVQSASSSASAGLSAFRHQC